MLKQGKGQKKYSTNEENSSETCYTPK